MVSNTTKSVDESWYKSDRVGPGPIYSTLALQNHQIHQFNFCKGELEFKTISIEVAAHY